MNKYNLDYCKANKVAVKCETQEDWDLIYKISNIKPEVSFGYATQYEEDTLYCGVCINVSSCNSWDDTNYFKKNNYEIITASDFVKSQKWCVAVTKINAPTLSDYLNNVRGTSIAPIDGGYLHFPIVEGMSKSWHDKKRNGYHELTFEQFKKYILNDMDKKIIGYKPKEQFKSFIPKLHDVGIATAINLYTVSCNPASLNNFREAGVLDLWFEPVYESTKKTVTLRSKQGDFTVDVEPGKSIKYDGAEYSISHLRALVSLSKPCHQINSFSCVFNTISIAPNCGGGKHEIPVEDIIKVIDAYES